MKSEVQVLPGPLPATISENARRGYTWNPLSRVEFVDHLQVAAVEDLVDQPADDHLVGFGHRSPPSPGLVGPILPRSGDVLPVAQTVIPTESGIQATEPELVDREGATRRASYHFGKQIG